MRIGMATAGAFIAYRYKTREKAASAFAWLGLDRVSGMGLAVALVAAAALLGVYFAR